MLQHSYIEGGPVIHSSIALAPKPGLGRTGMLTNWKERVSLQRKLWQGC